ncbi:hypothetical protein JX265_014028 [Neoarthrinium moseri]|uniref:Uncharacterized protein n=2 Tax=Neoarthrinium moseri TaxID=1658444 RepID=A0A9Q0AI39_9PEZI|nr:hypothetical protein JX266_013613 [Neoarthrinium moseri]KAI1846765.1 hypothetical protein JX265_014028 [Neoarthrinium moseri]
MAFIRALTVQHRETLLPLTHRWRRGEDPHVNQWTETPHQEVAFTIRHGSLKFGTIHTKIGETFYTHGDVQFRNYKDGKGKTKQLKLPAYAISDIRQFRQRFRNHVKAYSAQFVQDHDDPTYQEVGRLSKTSNDVNTLLEYEYTRRWTTGSLVVDPVSKVNGLRMPTVPEDAETLAGETVPSRVIVAQMGIIINRDVRQLFHAFIEEMLERRRSDKPEDIHVGYLELALLEAGNQDIFNDRLRHGRENDKKVS